VYINTRPRSLSIAERNRSNVVRSRDVVISEVERGWPSLRCAIAGIQWEQRVLRRCETEGAEPVQVAAHLYLGSQPYHHRTGLGQSDSDAFERFVVFQMLEKEYQRMPRERFQGLVTGAFHFLFQR